MHQIQKEKEEGAEYKDLVKKYGFDALETYAEWSKTHNAEDCESCGCSDEEVEDCETCGCEENPEYGHFNDTYSNYIDQYKAEDAERIDKDRMKCNKPRRTSGGSKKFVVKACKDGKEKIVRFGDPNMKIKKSNPKRRKSFRARHKCDQKKDKFSAGYWSCKKW